MKILLSIIGFCTLFSLSSTAAENLKCADQAVRAATEKNFKRFGASTSSCGAKLLSAGNYLETYLVCVSDETDPSEWIVVTEVAKADRSGRITRRCAVSFAEVQYDSSTPHFENSDDPDLLKTKECSADHGAEGRVVCR